MKNCSLLLLSLWVTLFGAAPTEARFYPIDAQMHPLEPSSPSRIHEIAHGEGIWLGLGLDGHLLKSTNGTDWAVLFGPEQNPLLQSPYPLTRLVHGNGTWVALSMNRRAGAWSDDGGETWTALSRESFPDALFDPGDRVQLNFFGFVNGEFVAAGSNGYLLRSVDGKVWREVTNRPYDRIKYVGYRESTGRHFLIGNTRLYAAETLEGPWEPVFASDQSLTSVVAQTDAGIFVLTVDSRETDQLLFSADGVEWATHANISWRLGSLFAADGQLVAYGETPDDISTSGNGIDWDPLPVSGLEADEWIHVSVSGLFIGAHRVFHAGDRFFISGMDADQKTWISSSRDAQSWQTDWRSATRSGLTFHAACSDGVDTIVAVASGGTLLRLRASTGEWRMVRAPAPHDPTSSANGEVIWDGAQFIATGRFTRTISSVDGENWTLRSEDSFEDIAGYPGNYVAVKWDGAFRSSDLTQWTRIEGLDPIFEGSPVAVEYFNGRFVISSLILAVSTDAETWEMLLPDDDPLTDDEAGIPRGHLLAGADLGGQPTFVVTGWGRSFRSFDGVTWTQSETFPSARHLVAGDGRLFGVEGRNVDVTTDGLTWQAIGPGVDLREFQVLGQSGLHALSPGVFIDGRLFLFGGTQKYFSFRLTEEGGAVGAGTVSLSQDVAMAGEGTGLGSNPTLLSAHREGGSRGEVSVTVDRVPGGTAGAGDLHGLPAVLTWADGETGLKSFSLKPVADGLLEGEETLEIALSEPTGGVVIGEDASAQVTIEDAPFEQWRLRHFGRSETAAAQPVGDWDADGVANFVEFALRMDPLADDAERLAEFTAGEPGQFPGTAQMPFYFRADQRFTISLATSPTLDFSDSEELLLWDVLTNVEAVNGAVGGTAFGRYPSFNIPADEVVFARYEFRYTEASEESD